MTTGWLAMSHFYRRCIPLLISFNTGTNPGCGVWPGVRRCGGGFGVDLRQPSAALRDRVVPPFANWQEHSALPLRSLQASQSSGREGCALVGTAVRTPTPQLASM